MQEGSKIIVEAGVTFHIFNHSYISGCGNMWLGIDTEEGAILQTEGSVIEGAFIGIDLKHTTSFKCKDMTFIDNYVGIAAGSPFTDNSFIKVSQEGNITGCTFYTDGDLPEPCAGCYYEGGWPANSGGVLYDKGYAAVFMKNTNGLSLGLPSDLNPTNEIKQMRNGVIMFDAEAYISSIYFHDFTGRVPFSIFHSGPLELNQNGIYSERSHGTILKNKIVDIMVGISGLESNDVITENLLDIYNEPGGLADTKGIFEERPQDLTIINNRIINGFEGIHIVDGTRPFNIQLNLFQRQVDRANNHGIYVETTHISGLTLGLIAQNSITIADGDNAYGIGFYDVTGIKAVDNSISFEYIESAGIHNTGLYLVNGTMCVVSHNDISGDPEYNKNEYDILNQNVGIDISDSPLTTLQCNDIENFDANLRISADCHMTDMRSNLIRDGAYGFDFISPAIIGLQDQTGNQWLGDYDSFGAFIDGPDVSKTAQFSQFLVDAFDNGGVFRPDPIGPLDVSGNQWFRHQPGDGIACVGIANPVPPLGARLIDLVRDSIVFNIYNDEMTWMRWASIYDLLLKHDSLLGYTPLDSFFSVQEVLPLGKLMDARQAITSIPDESIEDKLELEEKNQNLLNELVVIDSIITLDPLDKGDWLDLRNLKLDSLYDNHSEWNDIMDVELDSFRLVCEDVLDMLDTLTVSNDIEDLLKSVLIYKCKFILDDSVTSADTSAIINLLELCPWQGGYALGLENALYSRVMDSLSGFTIYPCEEPAPFQITPAPLPVIAGEVIQFYPNPANEVIHIKSRDVIQEIQLIDLTGNEIRRSLPDNTNSQFELENLPSGIYLLNVYHSGLMDTRKIIIIK